jgi:phosphatidylglycerol:prolipoprotein diacylglycerol transferase
MTFAWPIIQRIPLFGDAAVSPHGIFTALGIVVGVWMLQVRAQRWGIGAPVEDVGEAIWSLLTPALLAAIVGARGFYVLNHLEEFSGDPLAALAVWNGGLTLLGGVTAGVATAAVVIRRRGYDTRRLLDMTAPGLAAGIAIGRLGDLLIGDHIGAPAPDVPLAWRCTGDYWDRAENAIAYIAPQAYPAAGTPTQGCFTTPVIQTALLDALAAAATLLVVLAVARRVTRRPGTGVEAATFVLVYGLGRLGFDVLRQDERYAGLTASQWTALVAVLAVSTWLLSRRPWRRARAPDQPTTPTR